MMLHDAARRHPRVVVCLALIATTILGNAFVNHALARATLYLAVVTGSALLLERILRFEEIRPVRVRDAGLEAIALAASYVVGFWWLYAHFVLDFQPPQGWPRLAWLAILIGCVFNVLPALFLLARGYRLTDLGVRLRGLLAVPPVLAILVVSAAFSTSLAASWHELVKETGGSLWSGVGIAVTAALPEEFFRFVWQSRLAAWARNRALGWLLASVLWAILHGPKDWSDSGS